MGRDQLEGTTLYQLNQVLQELLLRCCTAGDIEGGFRMVRRVEGAGIGLAPRAGPRGPGGALVTGVGYLMLASS